MKYVCQVCGYVHEGDAAPAECPICHAPAEKFTVQAGEKTWAAEHVVGVAQGVPEDMLRRAASMAVCKINIDSDLRIAVTGAIREHFALNPSHFDPRQYLGPAREAVKQVVKHKIVNVLGCNNKA